MIHTKATLPKSNGQKKRPIIFQRLSHFSLLITLCLLPGISAFAQFTDNPAENTPIVTKQGEQAQPKITANANGGSYISWFDNSSGGYDVYLQRLDEDGNLLWDEAGLLVADRNYSSTVDYGIDSDASGHVYLTFRDDRSGADKITVTKVSPDGSFPWGSSGIQLSDGTGFVANPGVAAASDGSVVTAWFKDNLVQVTSLEQDGTVRWEKTLTDPLGLSTSDIKASDAPGSVGEVVLLMRTFGGFTTPGRLRAQKMSASGETLWGDQPIEVMTNGSLQFGNFPTIITDGSGGMVVSWYQSTPSLQTYVQRIDASGNQMFQSGGLALSLNGSQLRVSPSVAYDADTDRTYIFWTELNSGQSLNGVYGQLVDAVGNRVWGSNGLEIIPLQSSDIQQVRAGLLQGEPTVSYVNNSASSLQTARFTPEGEFAWAEGFVFLSGNGFSRLQKHSPSDLEHILVWQTASDSDIYAQNINFEGKLGIFDDGDTSVNLSVSYNSSWNLVSMPIDAADANPQTVFPSSVPGSLFLYDGSYSQENSLQSATGYWLNFSDAAITEFTGEAVSELSRTLLSGWNLIAGASTPVQVNNNDEIIVPGTTYGFDGNYVAAETLEPGYAYWIRTTGEGSIDLEPAGKAHRDGLLSSRDQQQHLKEVLQHSFDRFIIRTGTLDEVVQNRDPRPSKKGRSHRDLDTSPNNNDESSTHTLYLNGSLSNPLNPLRFSLPPVPPAGARDVRFVTNNWLTESSSGSILVQGNNKGSSLTFVGKSDIFSGSNRLYEYEPELSSNDTETSGGVYDNDGSTESNGQNQASDPYINSRQDRFISGYQLSFYSDGETKGQAHIRIGETVEIPQGVDEIRFREQSTRLEEPGIAELLPNVPNPFNPSTMIHFRLSEPAPVTLDVYSLTGQHIKTLIQGSLQQGTHAVRFDASDLASGIYLYRLQASGEVTTRKMILIE